MCIQIKKHPHYRVLGYLQMIVAIMCLISWQSAWPETSRFYIGLSDNFEAELKQYPAKGDHAILWISPDYGLRKGQHEMASILSGQGIEVFMVDLNETFFLSPGSSAMKELSGKYVAELVDQLSGRDGKQIILMSSYYGAIPVLRGAREWQKHSKKQTGLAGAILFSPSLNKSVPDLGKDPEYFPIIDSTNIPVMIFQGQMALNRWQLEPVLKRLYAGGSKAFYKIMPGVASLYYRDKRPPDAEAAFQQVPADIK